MKLERARAAGEAAESEDVAAQAASLGLRCQVAKLCIESGRVSGKAPNFREMLPTPSGDATPLHPGAAERPPPRSEEPEPGAAESLRNPDPLFEPKSEPEDPGGVVAVESSADEHAAELANEPLAAEAHAEEQAIEPAEKPAEEPEPPSPTTPEALEAPEEPPVADGCYFGSLDGLSLCLRARRRTARPRTPAEEHADKHDESSADEEPTEEPAACEATEAAAAEEPAAESRRCACVCVRACVRACVRPCVRASVCTRTP